MTNRQLTFAELKRLYNRPAKILTDIERVRGRLQNHASRRDLALIRTLKEDYLAAQTELAQAYQDPRHKSDLMKIRLMN